MDIKSIKSKSWTAWLCFFLAANIIAVLLLTGLAAIGYSGGKLEVIKTPFIDYKDTMVFKERTRTYFSELLSLIAEPSPTDTSTSYQKMTKQWPNDGKNLKNYAVNQNTGLVLKNTNDNPSFSTTRLNNEGDNLRYYAVNQDTGLVLKNIEGDTSFSISGGIPVLPEGYNYCWYFDGHQVRIIDDGRPVDVERLDSGYRGLIPNFNIYTDTPAQLANSRVLLAVREPLVSNPYGHSMYYWEQQFLSVIGWVYIALGVLGIGLLAYAIIRRRDKREYDRVLASWSSKLWLEVKILLSVLALSFSVAFSFNFSGRYSGSFEWILGITFVSCFILFGFWWFYLMFADLIINRKNFFTHNLINSVIKWYQKYESQYSWQKSMHKRAYSLLAAEAVLALVSVLFFVNSTHSGGFGSFLAAVLIAGAGVYLIYRYLRRYDQTITDLGKLVDHIELIKAGDMKTRLELATDADMYSTAQNLNSIQEGMKIAVAEKTKSERMKIELITNVSHDLKTPLTSIISYADLLAKEEGLPEHVNDYVKILAQKSERLKNLIQDLFDLSKASSDNITLDMERIDLARLIKQTVADMEEQINASALAFRLNIPDEPVYIISDGKKLYRVWENLITNTLKYSLAGSRVFIDLIVNDTGILATIKNTANYEMNFGEDEILQRFVRGDESRTTEGSGLGLSIAQSFTQICGGQFSIKIDGDLFKVELRFNPI